MILKDKMRKIFGSKAFYIVFSILASIAIWLYVAQVENDELGIPVNGIKVEFINEDYITDKGLVITDINTKTVNLTFYGKRNTVTQLNNSNVSVTVDLSEITTSGLSSNQLRYKVDYPPDITEPPTITSRSHGYITVIVDKLVTKDIPVRPTYNGGTAEGYQADPIEVNPETISISGPEELVSKVTHAWVNVMRENISKTVEEDFPFLLLDEEGHEVVSEYITAAQDTIRVTIPVVMVKEVPLVVNLTPGAGANESNTVWTISPSTIKISGDAETLNNLNNILIGTIDLSQFLTATTVKFPIAIPNDTTNLTGETEATVTVSIAGLETTHLSATNIQVTNMTSGYSAQLITQSLDITLRGVKEEIEAYNKEIEAAKLTNTTLTNIRIVADLSEYGETTGTFTVVAKVYVDGYTNIGAVGEYKVTVSVTKD